MSSIETDAVLAMIRRQRHRGLTVRQLVDSLTEGSAGSRSALRHDLRQTLRLLVREGLVVLGRGKRYFAVEEAAFVSGRLDARADGTLVVRPEDGGDEILVPTRGRRGALVGDRVTVKIERARKTATALGLREGTVVKVLERVRRSVVGRWSARRGAPSVRSLDRRAPGWIRVVDGGGVGRPEEGDLVVVELERSVAAERRPRGSLVETLGAIDGPGVVDAAVVRLFDLPGAFPPEVVAEVAACPAGLDPLEISDRDDLRDRPVVTIDPETARDFDDAVSAEAGANGRIVVEVHIADVAAYVGEGSAIDHEARRRGTSVYLPSRCVPMLPERLSGELCSLRPGEDRLALSVRFAVAEDGEVSSFGYRPSLVRSRLRLSYDQVTAWLEKTPAEWPAEARPVMESLLLLDEAAARLTRARLARGSLDLDLAEPEFLLDEGGRVTGIRARRRSRSHRLIEELMIAANSGVARVLAEAGEPTLFRVHDSPDGQRLAELAELVGELGLGCKLPLKPEPRDVLRLLEEVRGRSYEQLISVLVLRAQARASYSAEPRGHFGLALADYLHFTSPIRRYPDLVCHRALRRLLGDGPQSASRDGGEKPRSPLVNLAASCSELEQRADEAARLAATWASVILLAERVGDDLDGTITGVAEIGLFVQIDELLVDGLIHISDLVDDVYLFERRRHRLAGIRSRRTWRLGDRVRVRVLSVKLETMQIELIPSEMVLAAARRDRQNRRRRRF